MQISYKQDEMAKDESNLEYGARNAKRKNEIRANLDKAKYLSVGSPVHKESKRR